MYFGYLDAVAVDIVQGGRREESGAVVVVHFHGPRVAHRTVAFQKLHGSQRGEDDLLCFYTSCVGGARPSHGGGGGKK